jgi:methyl-accepting chemotaxis protein
MFKNVKVGTRLILGFLVVALLGAAVAGIGIYNMDQMNDRAQRVYEQDLKGISYLKEANIDLIYIGRALRSAMLSSTEAERRKHLDSVTHNTKLMNDNLEQARSRFMTGDGKRIFGELESQLHEYDATVGTLVGKIKADPLDQNRDSVEYLFKDFGARSDAADDKMSELAQRKENRARTAAEANTDAYQHGRNLMLLLVVCSALSGVALGVLMTRNLTRQLGGEPAYAAQVADRIAAGDLVTSVELREGDRASLLFAMNTMRDRLAEIVTQVRGGTDAIASASNQIASGNLDLSSRTEEQASSLEETASSMEELTSTVKQNADNARQANALAMTASDVASQGGAVVAQVVQTMGAINTSSNKIVDIIAVIDGIAFQTNILALNAAVEAARAGEQGRGFAVVAGEVRTLAQRSAAAAKEIKELISDSVEKVGTGSKLVDQAGATMHEIVGSIQRVADIMSEITAASQEQTAGIEQINGAITQMDTVTQQNAGLVEEAAAASEGLQNQARKLAELVSVFQVAGRLAAPQTALARAEPRVPVAPAVTKPARPAPLPAPAHARASASARPAARTPAAASPAPARAFAKPAAGADGDWEEF